MTKQIGDILIFEGETYHIKDYILESFFKGNPKLKKFHSSNTALTRGYVGNFSVENEKLKVTDIRIFDGNTVNLKLKSIFKNVFKGKTDCDWFSGFIRIDNYNEYQSKKEDQKYTLLEFHKGNYIGKRSFNYLDFQSFKALQFKQFKTTEEYKKLKENITKTLGSEYQADTLILKNILKFI
ncbi:hypothetical protein [uncultured Tenacibaculum sp.]|uniref:hypothetical protein n=1 Tax=uncultured Tenacibaculum sp. TaxID=174713 RepID=UPI00261FC8F6|nr:hypothetical protein [uncultured Tenacibaculum sp.]